MTKVLNKRNAKRITAILLAVIAVVSSILIIPANAAGKEVTITFRILSPRVGSRYCRLATVSRVYLCIPIRVRVRFSAIRWVMASLV